MAGCEALLTAYAHLIKLKKLKRTGWLRSGIEPLDCESVAEHSLGTGWLGFLVACELYPELDAPKVMLLGCIHDLGEAVTGDVLPWDKALDPDFDAKERAGALEAAAGLKALPRFTALYDEYHAGETPEARLVHQVDKLEMLLQAYFYEEETGLDLSQFFDSLPTDFWDERLRQALDVLLTRRLSGGHKKNGDL